jgi:signal transduction histidine kinase
VKYCDDGGTIKVNLSHRGKKAYLTISNDYADGEGEDYSRFFERFYRADQSHNSEKAGYGIGLSMAESLVEMFNGKISVNYKNKIITFTVIL